MLSRVISEYPSNLFFLPRIIPYVLLYKKKWTLLHYNISSSFAGYSYVQVFLRL